MNAIYKLLVSDTGGLFDEVQIGKVCDYVAENYAAHPPTGGSRIVVQLAIHATSSNLEKEVSKTYAQIISSSKVELEEFILLGSSIVKLLAVARMYGPTALKGCSINLPFAELECEPKKYALHMGSMKALESLVMLWCKTASRLLSPEVCPAMRSNQIADIIVKMAEICTELESKNISPNVIMALCESITKAATAAPVVPGHTSEVHSLIAAASGLLRWVEHVLVRQPQSETPLKSAEQSALCVAITHVGSTSARLIGTVTRSHADSPAITCLLQGVLNILEALIAPCASQVRETERLMLLSLISGAPSSASVGAALTVEHRSSKQLGGRPPLFLQASSKPVASSKETAASAGATSAGTTQGRRLAQSAGVLSAAAVALVDVLRSALEDFPGAVLQLLLQQSIVRMLLSLCADLPALDAVARLLTCCARYLQRHDGLANDARLRCLRNWLLPGDAVNSGKSLDPGIVQTVLAFEVLQMDGGGSDGQTSAAEAEQITRRYAQRLTQALSSAPRDHPTAAVEAAAVLLQSALRLHGGCRTAEGWVAILRVMGPQLLRDAVATLQPVARTALGTAKRGAGGDSGADPQELELQIARHVNGSTPAEQCGGLDPTQLPLVVTWLQALCLPTIGVDAQSAISATAVHTSPAANRATGSGSGGKRKRAHDAESFDFFDEGGSDSDAHPSSAPGASGGGGGSARKRLKKRSANSPAGTTGVSRGGALFNKPVVFEQSLLEGHLMVLVEHDLVGSALLILASRLDCRHHTPIWSSAQKEQEPEQGAVEGSLHEAVHAANCAALLLSVAAVPLAPHVVSALTAILGSLLARIAQGLSWRTRHLQAATGYHATADHLLSSAQRISMEDASHHPERALFLCQAALHALRFQSALCGKVDVQTAALETLLGSAVHSLAKLLKAQQSQWDSSVNCVLSHRHASRDVAAGGNSNEEESEYQNSAGQSEPMEESLPAYTADSSAPSSGSGASGATLLVVHLDLLLLHRTATAIVSSCRGILPGAAGASSAAGSDQDSSLQKVLTHSLRGHPAVVRAGQCLAVCMLDALFRRLHDPLGCHASPIETPLAKAALSVLDLAYSPRAPGSKVTTVGLCGFIRYAALLSPPDALAALRELCLARADIAESVGADVFSAELQTLSEGGVLRLLLGSDLTAAVEVIVLPLLALAAQSDSEDAVEVVDGILHLLDAYSAAEDGTPQFLDICVEILLARLYTVPLNMAAAIGALLRAGKIGLVVPKRYLLDEVPGLYLEFHRRAAFPNAAISLDGGSYTELAAIAKLLGVAVCDTSQGAFMSVSTFRKVLRRVVWSLGASPRCDGASLVALKTLCSQMAEQTWRINRRTDAAALSAGRIDSAVADRLQAEFMMLMASLLVDIWHAKTQAYCEQSLRCFNVLIVLLRQSDVVKFLPKILIVVDSALGGASAAVRLAAVQLVATLCPLLPAEVLATNLSSLVVNLYPLLDADPLHNLAGPSRLTHAAAAVRTQLPSATSATQLAGRGASSRGTGTHQSSAGQHRTAAAESPADRLVQEFGEDLRALGDMRGFPASVYVPHHIGDAAQGSGATLSALLETTCALDVSAALAKETKTKAVEVIRSLFLGRREDIQSHIQTVVYIPDLPELRDVHALHQQEVRALTLEQSLQLLCDMLAHTSVHVRLVAVNRLTLMCQECREQLSAILEARSSDTTASSSADHIVSAVLQALLRLCAKETDARVLAACARCLGEVGAIDPSRVGVQLDTARTSDLTRASTTSGYAAGNQFPWRMEAKDLCLHFLENYLVPGQRSADGSAAQDKSSFAIQLLLRELAAAMAQEAPSAATAAGPDGGMPEALKDLLASKGVLDVTEPFWYTSYTVSDVLPARVPPIYTANLSFSRWMWLFTRYLISQCKGHLSSIFTSVRGFVRLSNEMCQYMLPHLIYDVLVNSPFPSPDGRQPRSTAAHPLKYIIQELCLVLRGSGGASGEVGAMEGRKYSHNDQMCIQAIFTLLDTLTSWVTRCVQKIGVSYARSSPYLDIAKYNAASFNIDENGISRIRLLVDSIPSELLCQAALGVKAYSRALRYLEVHARRVHRLKDEPNALITLSAEVMAGADFPPVPARPPRNPATITASADEAGAMGIWSPDHSGGVLPQLTAPQVDALMTVFSSLEDPDSLQGALVMNHVHGHPARPQHRILELELTDDWLGALLEYGLVHNGQQFSNSLHHHIHAVKVKADANAASGIVKHELSTGAAAAPDSGAPGGLPGHNQPLGISEIAELERRKLRCMVELGHYDAVIDQASALGDKLSELQSALVPLGAEAAWRLMRWDDLDGFLARYEGAAAPGSTLQTTTSRTSAATLVAPLLDGDRFQLSVGKLLLNLHRQDRSEFDRELEQARSQTMSALSAACMESYGRAYPILARLHCLHELQSGYELSLHDDTPPAEDAKKEYLDTLGWENRLKFMSPSVPQRSTILAVRRCILGVCRMPDQVAQNWLQFSDSMRRLGKFDAAHLAVRNAESFGLDPESVLLQECRILRESGEVTRALMLLEPVEVDQTAINAALRNHRQGVPLPAHLDSEAKRKALAERIKLATQLMVDSKQKQGNVIISRYKTVIALDKYWMEAYFDLAKYYEFLYHDGRSKQAQTVAELQALLESPVSQNPPPNARGPTPLALLQQQLPVDTQTMCTNLQQAIEMFGNCLMLGHELAMQVLPRLLTLWLTFTALQDDATALLGDLQRSGSAGNGNGNGGSSRRAGGGDPASILVAAQKRANDSMAKVCNEVPASTWYLCMSQLVSRVLHRNEDTVKVIVAILLKILAAYPKEGIWHMAGLMFSCNGDRKKIAKKLLQDTYKVLNAAKSADAVMLVDSQKLCTKLIDLAAYQCKERKIRWTMHPDVRLENFLVPTQAVLHHTNPLRLVDPASGSAAGVAAVGASNYYHSDRMYIHSFNETVDVANSKAKPKTITLRTQCGKTVRFLCKQEKDGDLRKDARMMEFNTVVNRLLQECPDGRKRHLRLRTFAVVCLNEECGILEWVNNTECLRQLINKAHSFWPDLYPNLPYKDVFQAIVDLQSKPDDDIPQMLQKYARVMAETHYKPCFHRWFLEQFPDPTAWQEARSRFVRSAAVWSGVGHVIGLGDRHTENILLDVTSGEMVHVDFDCLFDKGLTLQRPEIVPFRLTPNLVDAMGVTGVEGAYRRTLEVTMGVLRDNRDTLLSVLEPFLRDPTVSWSRSGRAQRSLDASAAGGAATTTGSKTTVPAKDHENREAREMLQKISQRLSGVYNIMHPHREKFVRAATRRNEPVPARGIGVSKEEMLPLSVPGQVQRLIDEATAPENLVQMYIGWQPWV